MDAGRFDIHTHILPPDWPDLKERYGYGGFVQLEHHGPGCCHMLKDGEFFREVSANCYDPEVRIEECDRTGVEVQVLSTVPIMFSYWAEPQHTHDLSRLLNDHIAGVVRDFPSRFVGLGTLPMQDPDRAIEEVERGVEELGLEGFEIGTHVQGRNLSEPEFRPLFRRMAELNAALFVHPWDMMGMESMEKYWLPWLVGMPAETSRAIASFVFSGIFEEIPDLRVIFAHGGGSFPFTIGRFDHGHAVRPDLCAIDNEQSPRTYIDRIYVDSLVHDPDALRYLMKLHGPERIALGSDYPFPLGEAEPGSLIDSMEDISPEDRERMLRGTAIEWLGLEQGAYTQ